MENSMNVDIYFKCMSFPGCLWLAVLNFLSIVLAFASIVCVALTSGIALFSVKAQVMGVFTQVPRVNQQQHTIIWSDGEWWKLMVSQSVGPFKADVLEISEQKW